MKRRILATALLIAMLISLVSVVSISTNAATVGESLVPYEYTTDNRCPVTIYSGDPLKTFKMMNTDYDTGFTFTAGSWGADSEAIFALNKKYVAVSFIIGHIDNKGSASNDIQVYADGVLVDTINLKNNMPTISYTLNVVGVTQLKLVNYVHGYSYGYGVANGTAYTNETYPYESLPTLSDTEVVKTVAIDTDKKILPYQYSTDNRCPVTLYSGDATKTFSMMGQPYSEGIVFSAGSWSAENECLFNLGGICEKITLTAGHVSGYGGASNDFYFYADGELIYSELFTSGMAAKNIELDVTGVNQLRIQNITNGYSYGYGFANITVTHTHKEVVDDAVPSTCTENGLTEGKHCETCGKVLVEQRATITKEHSWGEYSSNNDATTEKDGTKTRTCSVCGTKDTVTDAGTKLPKPEPEEKPVEIKDTSKIFTDVKAKKWYTNAVNYAYSYGFIAGVSETEFGRDVPVTRGMFITILARIAGVDTGKEANKVNTKFSDVKSGKYYTAAIKWASENGVVNGLTATEFAPNAAIERQQLCTMIVNFAAYMEIELNSNQKEISFNDSTSIRKYAKKAVSTCQTAGIVSGYAENGGTAFKPLNTATRAEAAQILYKFHKDFVA